jgi:hypothetical protein
LSTTCGDCKPTIETCGCNTGFVRLRPSKSHPTAFPSTGGDVCSGPCSGLTLAVDEVALLPNVWQRFLALSVLVVCFAFVKSARQIP